MAKYLILAFWGIVFIVATVLLVRSTNPDEEPIQIIEIAQQKVNTPDLVDPKVVTVTYGDSLYHEQTCSSIGSDSRQMSLSKALELGFEPCPFCVENEGG